MKRTVQFKLEATREDEVQILKLLDRGKNLYNLALTECKKRLNKIRTDHEYRELLAERRILRLTKSSLKEVDARLRAIVVHRYQLTAVSIEKFVKDHGNYLLEGFNSQFAQVLADRAVWAIERVLYRKARKVRFKGKWDNFLGSLNAKSTATGFFLDTKTFSITYGKRLRLPLVTRYRYDHGYHAWYLEQIVDNIRNHGTENIAYVRLVRRIVKGGNVFHAQFVIDVRPVRMNDEAVDAENLKIIRSNSEKLAKAIADGKPTTRMRFQPLVSRVIEFPKTTPLLERIREVGLAHKFSIGIDMGPKFIAAYLRNEDEILALLQPTLQKVADYDQELRRLQRKQDRQRRATNPQNYKPDGTVKKGLLRWQRTKGYNQTRAQIREIHRLLRETRKTGLNELANLFNTLGRTIKAEDISYKSWQTLYGKSMGCYAPSHLMKEVYSKAESAGSDCVKIPLASALSQHCLCGHRQKKKLSWRLHECRECGATGQRDVFSAYLAEQFGPSGVGGDPPLDHEADRQLLAASRSVFKAQTASGRGVGFVLHLMLRHPAEADGRQSCSPANVDRHRSESHEIPFSAYTGLKHFVDELRA